MRVVPVALSLAAVALLNAGCASSSSGSSTLTDGVILDSLSMERGACYGICEIYQLVLRAGGSATLRKQDGESLVPLTRGDAERFLAQAVAAGVMTLPRRIDADSALCPLRATDHSTYILTVYSGTDTRHIEHYSGCYATHDLRVAPRLERLVILERRLDDLAKQ
jgi:hypothetical protein